MSTSRPQAIEDILTQRELDVRARMRRIWLNKADRYRRRAAMAAAANRDSELSSEMYIDNFAKAYGLLVEAEQCLDMMSGQLISPVELRNRQETIKAFKAQIRDRLISYPAKWSEIKERFQP